MTVLNPSHTHSPGTCYIAGKSEHYSAAVLTEILFVLFMCNNRNLVTDQYQTEVLTQLIVLYYLLSSGIWNCSSSALLNECYSSINKT